MRLMNVESMRLEDFTEDPPTYAVLSHRWENEEVTYKDFELGRQEGLHGYRKVEASCQLARARGLKYIWIDTCCIDKGSSAELTEAINSMFRWYQEAHECYAFLCDVHTKSLDSTEARKLFRSSKWFTRGWTLQELIAPKHVVFYNSTWEELGCKSDLDYLLEQTTAIDGDVLGGRKELGQCSIAQRMSWAASRTTTRLEDQAYSLLGLFDVNMPMLYGEGKNAFRRLQEEIIKQSDDQTIFAWRDKQSFKQILAPSVSCFKGLHDVICVYPTSDDRTGYTLANSGLSIQLMLIPWSMNTYLVPLGCGLVKSVSRSRDSQKRGSTRGYDRVCIFVRQLEHSRHFIRVSIGDLDAIDMDSDDIAKIRDLFNITSQRLYLRQNIASVQLPPRFHGFQFLFHPNPLFRNTRPHAADVLCHTPWSVHVCQMQVKSFGFHAAGAFRFNIRTTEDKSLFRSRERTPKQLFMVFGFDIDFAPLCLVTSKIPSLTKFESLGNLGDLSADIKLEALDMRWLLSQIEKGKDEDTVLAFRGDRVEATKVTCRSLSIQLSFSLESLPNGEEAWHVLLDSWEGPKSMIHHFRAASDPVADVFIEKGGYRLTRIAAPGSVTM